VDPRAGLDVLQKKNPRPGVHNSDTYEDQKSPLCGTAGYTQK